MGLSIEQALQMILIYRRPVGDGRARSRLRWVLVSRRWSDEAVVEVRRRARRVCREAVLGSDGAEE